MKTNIIFKTRKIDDRTIELEILPKVEVVVFKVSEDVNKALEKYGNKSKLVKQAIKEFLDGKLKIRKVKTGRPTKSVGVKLYSEIRYKLDRTAEKLGINRSELLRRIVIAKLKELGEL